MKRRTMPQMLAMMLPDDRARMEGILADIADVHRTIEGFKATVERDNGMKPGTLTRPKRRKRRR